MSKSMQRRIKIQGGNMTLEQEAEEAVADEVGCGLEKKDAGWFWNIGTDEEMVVHPAEEDLINMLVSRELRLRKIGEEAMKPYVSIARIIELAIPTLAKGKP